MAPPSFVAGTIPDPTSTVDGPGIPHRGIYHTDQLQPNVLHVNGQPNGQPNGQSTPQARLLTVDEALQYSPLSSIVPFNSGKEPALNTGSWC